MPREEKGHRRNMGKKAHQYTKQRMMENRMTDGWVLKQKIACEKELTETERGPRIPDMDRAHQLKVRERQRFFEEVFQHDVDVYLSSAHLSIRDYTRPPIGSISSMEVNVDMLEQMELIDISDQEVLDVFLSSGGEDNVLNSTMSVNANNNPEGVITNGLLRHVLEGFDSKSRVSSTTSNSSDSHITNANLGDTCGVMSQDCVTCTNTVKRIASPQEREEKSLTSSSM
ncbi:dysbindin-like isoform X2 [Phyllopteryx taeniolatus]|uniref:dysbindin-like isoform X2 n=1 Tax=Phyllopteryx taeniolatus TaxID=161469 RepID=UPI002AD205A3|nr:dysbindin-like isoform X2 [Phyllopteryx taeniolatus]